MANHKPTRPDHLAGRGAAFWDACQKEYDVRDVAGLELLQGAAEALATAEASRLTIEAEGAIFRDRFGQPRPHPAVKSQKDALLVFSRLIRQLAIDVPQEQQK